MDGLKLLKQARDNDLAVSADGDRLKIRGPRKAGKLAKLLLVHKTAILALLQTSTLSTVYRTLNPEVGSVDGDSPETGEPAPRADIPDPGNVQCRFCLECSQVTAEGMADCARGILNRDYPASEWHICLFFRLDPGQKATFRKLREALLMAAWPLSPVTTAAGSTAEPCGDGATPSPPRLQAAQMIRETRLAGDRGRAIAMRDAWRERLAICEIDGRLGPERSEQVTQKELERILH